MQQTVGCVKTKICSSNKVHNSTCAETSEGPGPRLKKAVPRNQTVPIRRIVVFMHEATNIASVRRRHYERHKEMGKTIAAGLCGACAFRKG